MPFWGGATIPLAKLIRAAREVNDYKPKYVVEQVVKAVAGIDRPTIACLGLAFKPDIDDLRESPALDITIELAKRGYNILAVEPNIHELPSVLQPYNNVILSAISDIASKADLAVVLVKHSLFIGLQATNISKNKTIDFVRI